MTLGFMCQRLTGKTEVTVIDYMTGEVIIKQDAEALVPSQDFVVDWDFSNGHIIYVTAE